MSSVVKCDGDYLHDPKVQQEIERAGMPVYYWESDSRERKEWVIARDGPLNDLLAKLDFKPDDRCIQVCFGAPKIGSVIGLNAGMNTPPEVARQFRADFEKNCLTLAQTEIDRTYARKGADGVFEVHARATAVMFPHIYSVGQDGMQPHAHYHLFKLADVRTLDGEKARDASWHATYQVQGDNRAWLAKATADSLRDQGYNPKWEDGRLTVEGVKPELLVAFSTLLEIVERHEAEKGEPLTPKERDIVARDRPGRDRPDGDLPSLEQCQAEWAARRERAFPEQQPVRSEAVRPLDADAASWATSKLIREESARLSHNCPAGFSHAELREALHYQAINVRGLTAEHVESELTWFRRNPELYHAVRLERADPEHEVKFRAEPEREQPKAERVQSEREVREWTVDSDRPARSDPKREEREWTPPPDDRSQRYDRAEKTDETRREQCEQVRVNFDDLMAEKILDNAEKAKAGVLIRLDAANPDAVADFIASHTRQSYWSRQWEALSTAALHAPGNPHQKADYATAIFWKLTRENGEFLPKNCTLEIRNSQCLTTEQGHEIKQICQRDGAAIDAKIAVMRQEREQQRQRQQPEQEQHRQHGREVPR